MSPLPLVQDFPAGVIRVSRIVTANHPHTTPNSILGQTLRYYSKGRRATHKARVDCSYPQVGRNVCFLEERSCNSELMKSIQHILTSPRPFVMPSSLRSQDNQIKSRLSHAFRSRQLDLQAKKSFNHDSFGEMPHPPRPPEKVKVCGAEAFAPPKFVNQRPRSRLSSHASHSGESSAPTAVWRVNGVSHWSVFAPF
jgi:hypothetical protein